MAEKSDFETTIYETGYQAKIIGGRFIPVQVYEDIEMLTLGLGRYSQIRHSHPIEMDLYFVKDGFRILVTDFRVQRLYGIPEEKFQELHDMAMDRKVASITLLNSGEVRIETCLPQNKQDTSSESRIIAQGEISTNMLRDTEIPIDEDKRIAEDILGPRSQPLA